MKKKKKTGLIVKLLLLCFAVYAAVTLLSLQISINERRRNMDELQSQLDAQIRKNDRLREDLDSELDDEQVEKIAREKIGMVRPGERVYVDIGK